MADESFDPYLQWLGLAPAEQPPNHYRLLGIDLFESNVKIIEAAANQRMDYIKQCGKGSHSDASQKILYELATVQATLLNSEMKAAYDAQLKQQQQPAELPPPATAPPITGTVPPIPDIPLPTVVTEFPDQLGSDPRPKPSFQESNLGVIIAVVLGGLTVIGFYQLFLKP